MAVKKGLGKGLDSLITDKVNTKPAASKNNPTPKSEHAADAIMMNITKVEPNREQPRKKFDEDALLELAESIKQYGVLQPLLVQEREDYYEIVAGERRWRAAKIAGIKEIPVIIKKLTRQEIMEDSGACVNIHLRTPRRASIRPSVGAASAASFWLWLVLWLASEWCHVVNGRSLSLFREFLSRLASLLRSLLLMGTSEELAAEAAPTMHRTRAA